MLRTILRSMTLLGLAGLSCLAQSGANTEASKTDAAKTMEGAPKKFYRLDFLVRELENERAINSRSYAMIVRSNTERGSMRAGEQVPYASSSGASTQWQQIDVGVSIDCRKLEELGERVALDLRAEISSVVENHDNGVSAARPIIRSNRWESTVLLPLKQPTVLFSSDDPASKHTMQLQLTVTPLR